MTALSIPGDAAERVFVAMIEAATVRNAERDE